MCGIFGYIGPKTTAGDIIIEGLKRLDYRGYDSWGVGVVSQGKIFIEKQPGKISELTTIKNLPESHEAIGHTRWATTGKVNQVNAHPHYSTDKSFCLAQNGITENYEELRDDLRKKGYKFISETDTEVIVRLIEEEQKTHAKLLDAVRSAFLKLTGRNTIILLTDQGEIIAARNGSPLVIGRNYETDEIFISSDTLSFAPFVNKMVAINNGDLVDIHHNDVHIFDIHSGKEIQLQEEKLNMHSDKVDKEGYDHFMLKEIHETPFVVRQLLNQDKKSLEELSVAIKNAKHVYTIGSGTTGGAASQIAFYLREYAHINATSLIGADAKEYFQLFTKDDIIIAPSQSGETADVLEVLEYVKEKGMKIASVVNMPGSLMTRMSDYKFMCQAGPEICVMSTKVFVSHITWGYLLAKTMAGEYDDAKIAVHSLADNMEKYLQDATNLDTIKKLAKKLEKSKDIFLLGKSQNLQIMKEGMVKLIEATYKHAHAIPSGDLKHYAITLMEKDVPVIVALSEDSVKTDVVTSIDEVRLRGAEVIGIAAKKIENFDYFLEVPDTGETSAIMHVIPLQLLAYYIAVALGNNVDKPRNIAKSVTVK